MDVLCDVMDENPLLVPVALKEVVFDGGTESWIGRHEGVKKQVQAGDTELIFIGDSICHFWAQEGAELWAAHYAPLRAINMGFGGDRVQHVLWRLQNGEIDGISPKVAVVLIGTNNSNDDPAENTAGAIKEICAILREKLPQTIILLLGIFPRNTPQDPQRLVNLEVNRIIARLDDGEWIRFLDISDAFMNDAGLIPGELMEDFLHPTSEGYRAWAEAMNPTLFTMLRESPNL